MNQVVSSPRVTELNDLLVMELTTATNTPEFSDFSVVKQNTSYILDKKRRREI